MQAYKGRKIKGISVAQRIFFPGATFRRVALSYLHEDDT